MAPANLQAFTSETKNTFSARDQAKTKYFSLAVKEICIAFEELQNQNSCCLREDTNRDVVKCEVSSAHKDKVNGVRVSLEDGSCVAPSKGKTSGYGKDHPLSNLVRWSKGNETADVNVKPTILPNRADGILSKIMFSDREPKSSNGSKFKETYHRKAKQSGMGLTERQKISSSPSLRDESRTGSGDMSKRKDLSIEKVGMRGFSPQAGRSRSHQFSGRAEKGMLHLQTKNNLKSADRRSMTLSNSNVGGTERKSDSEVENPRFTDDDSTAARRSKYVDVMPDASEAFFVKISKNGSQGHENIDNVVKVEMLKRLESPLPALKEPTASGLDASIDKAASPPSKLHKHTSEGICNSSHLDFVDRSWKLSPDPRNGNTGSNNVILKGQGLKRRRAVRLCDEEEMEDPKTPVHGGPARSYRALSAVSNFPNKRRHANSSPNIITLGDTAVAENSGLKESSSQLKNECKSHRTRTVERKPSFNSYLTPENLQPKKVPSKEEKTVFCSPKKSASAWRATDQHSVTKVASRVPNNGNSDSVSDGLKFSQDHSSGLRNKHDQPVDRINPTLKAPMINDSSTVARALIE